MTPQHLRRGLFSLALIVFTLLGLTALFSHQNWDRQIAAWFYTEKGWKWVDVQPWLWLYEYGTLPGLLLTLGATGVFYLSFVKPVLRPWRREALIILLISVVGGGIIVNAILKDYWGRARPREIQEFGGRWEHHAVAQRGIPGKGNSFPCGHCAISYLFVSLIIFYPKFPRIALSVAALGLGYGGLMSLARIGQGAHFPTDTFWSLGIVLLLTVLLYYFIFPPSQVPFAQWVLDKKQKRQGQVGLVLVLAAMVFFFLTRRPFFEDYKHSFALSPEIQTIHLQTNIDWEDITIHALEGEQGFIQTLVRGFGWPAATHEVKMEGFLQAEGIYYIDYQLISQGYFAEQRLATSIYVPERLTDTVIAVPSP